VDAPVFLSVVLPPPELLLVTDQTEMAVVFGSLPGQTIPHSVCPAWSIREVGMITVSIARYKVPEHRPVWARWRFQYPPRCSRILGELLSRDEKIRVRSSHQERGCGARERSDPRASQRLALPLRKQRV
jgi:hypothetical protein